MKTTYIVAALFGALVAIAPSHGLAQEGDPFDEFPTEEGHSSGKPLDELQYFSFGVQFFDFTGLNSRLADVGLGAPTLTSLEVGAGNERYYLNNLRLMLGSELSYMTSTYNSYSGAPGGQARLEAFNLTAAVGYTVVRSQRILLTPQVGVSRQLSWLSLRGDDQPAVSANTFFASPGNEGRLKLNQWVLRPSLGAHLVSKEQETAIGLKAGYQLGLGDRRWQATNGDIVGEPLDTRDGFFVTLLFSIAVP